MAEQAGLVVRGVSVGIGGAALGNHRRVLDDAQAQAVLRAAWDAGVRHFDTAPHYGLGLSETRIGDFLADLTAADRAEATVSTKVGRRLETAPATPDDEGFLVSRPWRRTWDFTRTGVRETLEASLHRLGLDAVETVYLHDPERAGLDGSLREGVAALAGLKQAGLTRRAGVGSMDVAALLASARRHDDGVDDLMVAGRLTVLDDSGAPVAALCEESGTTITAAAVLNGGLLAAAQVEDGTFDYSVPSSEVLDRARRVVTVARRFGVPAGAVAVQYPLRLAPVKRLVLGLDSPEQVVETLGWLDTPIDDELWTELADSPVVA